MKKYIILISGMPGAGKTTFSEFLAGKLGAACYNKDHVKEIIADTVGFKDRAENRRQSDLAFNLMVYMAKRCMQQGLPVILESNFRQVEGDALRILIDEFGYLPITVFFTGDLNVLYSRFMRRIESGNRHIAHLSGAPGSFDEYCTIVRQFADFDIGGKRIEFDAGEFPKYIYDNVYAMIDGIINNKNLVYLKPDSSMKNELKSFLNEFVKNNESTINGCCGLTKFDNYDDWLNYMEHVEKGEVTGRLPSVTYAVMRISDNKIIGIVDLRLYLTEQKYQFGHVGLSVRPSERGHGYGTEITAWGIAQTKARGIGKIVISCGIENEYSRKMIVKNGLQFDGTYTDDDGSLLHTYSIEV